MEGLRGVAAGRVDRLEGRGGHDALARLRDARRLAQLAKLLEEVPKLGRQILRGRGHHPGGREVAELRESRESRELRVLRALPLLVHPRFQLLGLLDLAVHADAQVLHVSVFLGQLGQHVQEALQSGKAAPKPPPPTPAGAPTKRPPPPPPRPPPPLLPLPSP